MANDSLLVGWRKQWNRSLFRFLSRRARTVDIQDLAQETYLRLLRARDLSDVRNPQAYILRVASHVLSEWRNHQLPAESISQDEALLVDDRLPEFALEATLSQERLDRILGGMSPAMRAVLLLRLRDEHGVKVIAQELDMTVRQVRRYLARGYERLRGALED
jgi:RNA polymerase sigma-70 factor (ECF subfamily)